MSSYHHMRFTLLPLDSNSLHNLVQSRNPYPLLQGAGLLSLCTPVSFLLGGVPFSVQLNSSI